MGKSRDGLSTKIHSGVDALGNPVRLLLIPGEASEYPQAEALIAGFEVDYVFSLRQRRTERKRGGDDYGCLSTIAMIFQDSPTHVPPTPAFHWTCAKSRAGR
jgi:hypothetical protein